MQEKYPIANISASEQIILCKKKIEEKPEPAIVDSKGPTNISIQINGTTV